MDIQSQSQWYFRLEGIENVQPEFSDHLKVSVLQNLANGNARIILNFHDRVHSDIIDKSFEGSIANTSLNKLKLHQK